MSMHIFFFFCTVTQWLDCCCDHSISSLWMKWTIFKVTWPLLVFVRTESKQKFAPWFTHNDQILSNTSAHLFCYQGCYGVSRCIVFLNTLKLTQYAEKKKNFTVLKSSFSPSLACTVTLFSAGDSFVLRCLFKDHFVYLDKNPPGNAVKVKPLKHSLQQQLKSTACCNIANS